MGYYSPSIMMFNLQLRNGSSSLIQQLLDSYKAFSVAIFINIITRIFLSRRIVRLKDHFHLFRNIDRLQLLLLGKELYHGRKQLRVRTGK